MTKELTLKKPDAALITKAKDFKIASAKDMEGAVTFLSQLNKALDAVIEYKEKKTKPLNELLKVIRGETKPIEEELNGGIAALRRTMTDYQTEADRVADEAAKKIEDRVAPGKGNLSLDTALVKIGQIDRAEAVVSTGAGLVKFKEIAKLEVIDMKLLPLEYHVADEVAIRKAMLAGTKLPGVRYYTEKVPLNYR